MSNHNRHSNKSLRLSQMLPIIGIKRDLRQKGFLIPGIATVLVAVGLFATLGSPELFNYLLGIYLATIAYYFIYQLCGKYKPWWLLGACAVITMFLIISPVFALFDLVFRHILPGQIPQSENIGFIPLFIRMFFGAGMCEELLKALPVFLALGVGIKLKSPWRERIGVWEPLDGILLATASAVGFTLLETLGQYVPNQVSMVANQAGVGAGELLGLQLLIPRMIGSVAGHMAYSGYFGYFIGLSILKPSKRWQILAIGYLTASMLHALWNSSGAAGIWFTAATGVLSYTFLIAAILKARQLSPTRSQNWATQYLNPPPPPLPLQPIVQAPFSLSIQQQIIPLSIGTQLQVKDIPGLGAQARGVVAEVNSHPKDIDILGLKNCSNQVWTVTQPNGQQTRIDPGRSLKLAIGSKIDFGAAIGVIK